MPWSDFRRRAEYHSAFSLLEVIGVLAVLAILATIIFSATTKSVDTVVGRQENATLQAFAGALQNSILRYRYIPGQTGQSNWCQQIAVEMGVSTNAVFSNQRNPRVFTAPSGAPLQYWQGVNGASMPTNNCRAMIISSLGSALPASTSDPSNFDALWKTPDGSLPSIVDFAGWSPDDLKIQRLNLAPLFVNVQLTDSLSGGGQAYYLVDGVTNAVPNTGINAWFLQNTLIELMDESGSTNARLILQRDCANFYVGHTWRDVPYAPVPVQTNSEADSLAQAISAAAVMFTSSPYDANAVTSTPASTVTVISNFMVMYTNYTANGSPTSGGVYDSTWAAQTALQNALMDLVRNLAPGQCSPSP